MMTTDILIAAIKQYKIDNDKGDLEEISFYDLLGILEKIKERENRELESRRRLEEMWRTPSRPFRTPYRGYTHSDPLLNDQQRAEMLRLQHESNERLRVSREESDRRRQILVNPETLETQSPFPTRELLERRDTLLGLQSLSISTMDRVTCRNAITDWLNAGVIDNTLCHKLRQYAINIPQNITYHQLVEYLSISREPLERIPHVFLSAKENARPERIAQFREYTPYGAVVQDEWLEPDDTPRVTETRPTRWFNMFNTLR